MDIAKQVLSSAGMQTLGKSPLSEDKTSTDWPQKQDIHNRYVKNEKIKEYSAVKTVRKKKVPIEHICLCWVSWWFVLFVPFLPFWLSLFLWDESVVFLLPYVCFFVIIFPAAMGWLECTSKNNPQEKFAKAIFLALRSHFSTSRIT